VGKDNVGLSLYIFGLLDTTGFMPVVTQLQPTSWTLQSCDTIGFMPVVPQFQPFFERRPDG